MPRDFNAMRGSPTLFIFSSKAPFQVLSYFDLYNQNSQTFAHRLGHWIRVMYSLETKCKQTERIDVSLNSVAY